MLEPLAPPCPECELPASPVEALDRRNFLRFVGGTTALVASGSTLPGVPATLAAADTKPAASKRPSRPAEELIKELHSTLTSDQKKDACYAWDHGSARGTPTRMGMYNSAFGKKIGVVYTKAQQELVEQILRAIASDENGFRQLSRGGTWDNSKSMDACGAYIFGEPTDGQKFAFVFAGHHLTVRCDGNSQEGAAFGGPIYYGHSPNGYSERNVFHYQTKAVLSVYDALSEKQRKVAVVKGSPGEHAGSVRFRKKGDAHPGLSAGELNAGQRELIEEVMRTILSPYRKEDADEVMDIIKATGGLEKIHLAFYRDTDTEDSKGWDFWRLEGPGFVWNYRVLPHVHTYVNISSKV